MTKKRSGLVIEGSINKQNLMAYNMYKGHNQLKGLSEKTIKGYEYDLFAWFKFLNTYQDDKTYKEVLDSKMVNLESKKEQIDTTTPTGRLLFNMVASIYQFEREILLERQKEGIAIAKANGKYKGRKEIKIDNFEEYYNRYMNREINKGQFAAELNISRPTLDKLINEHQNKIDRI